MTPKEDRIEPFGRLFSFSSLPVHGIWPFSPTGTKVEEDAVFPVFLGLPAYSLSTLQMGTLPDPGRGFSIISIGSRNACLFVQGGNAIPASHNG